MTIPYRLGWERHPGRRLRARSGGQATPWPWWELALPLWGSVILSRRTPRAPKTARQREYVESMSRTYGTKDVGF
jgi:hypothetical protein